MTASEAVALIRADMTERGIGPRMLAQASGVAESTISLILGGTAVNPRWNTLSALLAALDRPVRADLVIDLVNSG